eukprot:4667485-Pleurochrysis_carterae.AAC.1
MGHQLERSRGALARQTFAQTFHRQSAVKARQDQDDRRSKLTLFKGGAKQCVSDSVKAKVADAFIPTRRGWLPARPRRPSSPPETLFVAPARRAVRNPAQPNAHVHRAAASKLKDQAEQRIPVDPPTLLTRQGAPSAASISSIVNGDDAQIEGVFGSAGGPSARLEPLSPGGWLVGQDWVAPAARSESADLRKA